jgi:hypothetical protein
LKSRQLNPDSALRILAATASIVFVALLNFVPVAANDVWLQLKIGEMIWNGGVIPHTVLFTFTWPRDFYFNAHEWLPSVLLHLLEVAVGHDGLILVEGGVALLQGWLCYILARRLSGSLGAGLFLACLAMLAANYRDQIRPEAFAIILMLAEFVVLTTYRAQGRVRTLWWSIPIGVLWANTHGSFLLGPIIAAIFAVGEGAEAARHRRGEALQTGRPYAIVALAMALVSLCNPMGIELWRFALTFTDSQAAKEFVTEWRPTFSPAFVTTPAFFIFCAVIALSIPLIVARRRQFTVTDFLLLSAFGLLALQRSRYVVLFGFVDLVVCAHLMHGWPALEKWKRPILGTVAALAAIGAGIVSQFGNVSGAYAYYTPSNDFSVVMNEKLADPAMVGNVYNSYELGAELIYKAYPRLKPSIDSRIDSYGDDYFLLHQRLLVDERLMNRFIADFDVRYILLLHRDFRTVKQMTSLQKTWRLKLMDHKMVLLERVDKAGAHPPKEAL